MERPALTSATQYLGHMAGQHGDSPCLHHVYVIWLSENRPLLEACARLLLNAFRCPECSNSWPLLRPGGVLAALGDGHEYHSISDTCKRCAAVVHFDQTHESRRAGLRWTRYTTDPARMGDRPTRCLGPRHWEGQV